MKHNLDEKQYCLDCELVGDNLTTDCLGHKVPRATEKLVAQGGYDYREGEGWVKNLNPTWQERVRKLVRIKVLGKCNEIKILNTYSGIAQIANCSIDIIKDIVSQVHKEEEDNAAKRLPLILNLIKQGKPYYVICQKMNLESEDLKAILEKACPVGSYEHNWLDMPNNEKYCTDCTRIKSKPKLGGIGHMSEPITKPTLNILGMFLAREYIWKMVLERNKNSQFLTLHSIAIHFAVDEEEISKLAQSLVGDNK